LDNRPGVFGWYFGPIAGILVILVSLGLVRQTSRAVRDGLREAARMEALAAANGAAHTVEIYLQERAAEAEYLANLCADGSVRSVTDFDSFTHTIAESHGEYRGFCWRWAADGPRWSQPAVYEPILPSGAAAIETALRSLRESPPSSLPARLLIGRDPSAGGPILGILKLMGSPERPGGGVFYAEFGPERLAQVLTVPFYKGRFGYHVSAGRETIWSDGGPEPAGETSGSHAQIETALFEERMNVTVWSLSGAGFDESKITRAAEAPFILLSMFAGIAVAALVEVARRSRRRRA
jgi:hypothetical protein